MLLNEYVKKYSPSETKDFIEQPTGLKKFIEQNLNKFTKQEQESIEPEEIQGTGLKSFIQRKQLGIPEPEREPTPEFYDVGIPKSTQTTQEKRITIFDKVKDFLNPKSPLAIRNNNPGNLKRPLDGHWLYDKYAKKDEDGNPMTDKWGHYIFQNSQAGWLMTYVDIDAKIAGKTKLYWLADKQGKGVTIKDLNQGPKGEVGYAEDKNWKYGVVNRYNKLTNSNITINTDVSTLDRDALQLAVLQQEGFLIPKIEGKEMDYALFSRLTTDVGVPTKKTEEFIDLSTPEQKKIYSGEVPDLKSFLEKRLPVTPKIDQELFNRLREKGVEDPEKFVDLPITDQREIWEETKDVKDSKEKVQKLVEGLVEKYKKTEKRKESVIDYINFFQGLKRDNIFPLINAVWDINEKTLDWLPDGIEKGIRPIFDKMELFHRGITGFFYDVVPDFVTQNILSIAEQLRKKPSFSLRHILFPGLYYTELEINKQLQKTDLDERIINWSKDTILKNQQSLIDNGFVLPEDHTFLDKLAFGAGSGFGSLALALGMSFLTGNPAAAATTFGGIIRGNIYVRAREAGVEIERANAISTMAGLTEGALEFIGLEMFLKSTKGAFSNMIVRMITEASQEFSQEVGENFWAKVGWGEDIGLFEEAGFSALIGAIVAAPTSVMVSSAEKKGYIKDLKSWGLTDKQAKDFYKHLLDNGKKNLNEIIEENVIKQATIEKAIGEITQTKPGVLDFDIENSLQDTKTEIRQNVAKEIKRIRESEGKKVETKEEGLRENLLGEEPLVSKTEKPVAIQEKKEKPKEEAIPKELEPLAKEARNYDSAEEFIDNIRNKGSIVFHQTGDIQADKILKEGFKSGKDLNIAEKRGCIYAAGNKVNDKLYSRTRVGESFEGQKPAKIAINIEGLKLYNATDHRVSSDIGSAIVRGDLSVLPKGFDGSIKYLKNGDIYEVALSPELATKRIINLTDFYNQAKGIKEAKPTPKKKKPTKKPVVKKTKPVDKKGLTKKQKYDIIDYNIGITTSTDKIQEIKTRLEQANELQKEGKFNEANKLFNEVLDIGEKDLKSLFDDLSSVSINVDRTLGNFFEYAEPTFQTKVSMSQKDYNDVVYRLSEISKGWKQDNLHISRVLDNLPKGKKIGVEYEGGIVYEPNVDFTFDKPLTDKEYFEISKLIRKADLAGSTLSADKKGINLYNISKFTNFKEFYENIQKFERSIKRFSEDRGGVRRDGSIRELLNIGEKKGGATRTYEQIRSSFRKEPQKEVKKAKPKKPKTALEKARERYELTKKKKAIEKRKAKEKRKAIVEEKIKKVQKKKKVEKKPKKKSVQKKLEIGTEEWLEEQQRIMDKIAEEAEKELDQEIKEELLKDPDIQKELKEIERIDRELEEFKKKTPTLESVIGVDYGIKVLEAYKKNLNVNFDTIVADTILTGRSFLGIKEEAWGKAEPGKGTITLAQQILRTTVHHELVHLLWEQENFNKLKKSGVFRGLDRKAIINDITGGKEMTREQISEKLAVGFEQFVKNKEKGVNAEKRVKGNALRRFFHNLWNALKKMFKGLRGNLNNVQDFYESIYSPVEPGKFNPVDLKISKDTQEYFQKKKMTSEQNKKLWSKQKSHPHIYKQALIGELNKKSRAGISMIEANQLIAAIESRVKRYAHKRKYQDMIDKGMNGWETVKPMSEFEKTQEFKNMTRKNALRRKFETLESFVVFHSTAQSILRDISEKTGNSYLEDVMSMDLNRGYDTYLTTKRKYNNEYQEIIKKHNEKLKANLIKEHGEIKGYKMFLEQRTSRSGASLTFQGAQKEGEFWQQITSSERIEILLAKFDEYKRKAMLRESEGGYGDGIKLRNLEKAYKMTKAEMKSVWDNASELEKELAAWWVKSSEELLLLINPVLKKMGLPEIDGIEGYSAIFREMEEKDISFNSIYDVLEYMLGEFGNKYRRINGVSKVWTKPRIDGPTGSPINGDAISNIQKDIKRKSYFIGVAPIVQQNISIVHDKYFKNNFIENFGKARWKVLSGWSKDLVTPFKQVSKKKANRIAVEVSRNVSLSYVLARITTSALQAASFNLGVAYLGYESTPFFAETTKLMMPGTKSRQEVIDFVYKTFPQLKDRFFLPIEAEIRNAVAKSRLGLTKNQVLKMSSMLARFFDKQAIVPLAYTTYQLELSRPNGTPETAYREVMNMIDETQPTAFLKDLPKALGGAGEGSTILYILGFLRNYATKLTRFTFNRTFRPDKIYRLTEGTKAQKIRKAIFQTGWNALWGYLITGVLTFILRHGRLPNKDPEKDGKDWLEILSYPYTGIFGAGHLLSLVINNINNFSTAPSQLANRLIWAYQAASKNKKGERNILKATEHLIKFELMRNGLPLSQSEFIYRATLKAIKKNKPEFWDLLSTALYSENRLEERVEKHGLIDTFDVDNFVDIPNIDINIDIDI